MRLRSGRSLPNFGSMDWIAAIEREGHALSTAARHDFKAAVPACPGWDVNDLLAHIGAIHHRVAILVRTARTEPWSKDDDSAPQPPSGNLLGWYEAGLADLLEAFRVADPSTPLWSWSGPVTGAFWLRRMTQETMIHRVDAEQATGVAGPVDATLAVDGIDELFNLFLPRRHAGKATGQGEIIHVHATDAEGEWLLTLTGDGLSVERGHAKGDVAVRGPAGDLLLWLWGRQPIDGLEVFGDAALANRFRDLAAI
ncbi:MAG: maleylpyruvate isomerase family mycothiol-dependent enzyme [Actinomycetia bacterium]|nr:maleylpyruvate isomerase family mycothiol-dependent enzyme [Actinomycetes bacterium]